MNYIIEKALDNKRISPEEALILLREVDWTEIVHAGNEIRKRRYPQNKVGYTAYRIINYTNICSIQCSFCSFCRSRENPESFVLSLDQIRQKALEAKSLGVNQIFLQGGVHAGLPLNYYVDTLQMLTQELHVEVRAFSPVELVYIAKAHHMPLTDLLDLLKKAGLSSVPGAGAELLSDSMRQKLSPKKLSAKEWGDTMIHCHEKGLPGSANIVFGSDETPKDIIEHLQVIRDIQDKTQGFLTFVAWTFQPQTPHFPIRHVTGQEYLKIIGLCRLFFDNISHIEVSLLGMGTSLGELGLYSGADDINSIVIEENVLKSHGLTTIEEAESFIKNAGFTPYFRRFNFD
jgi:cyclic dehypoxanthinyl futalosine synthase